MALHPKLRLRLFPLKYMFGSITTLLTVCRFLGNVGLGSPAQDILSEKSVMNPSDYLEPHETARAAAGAAYPSAAGLARTSRLARAIGDGALPKE